MKYTREEFNRLGQIAKQTLQTTGFYKGAKGRIMSHFDLFNFSEFATQLEAMRLFFCKFVGDIDPGDVERIAFGEDRVEMPKYLADPIISRYIIALWRLELGK